MKKKKKPSIFFSDPADKTISKESKSTIETFVEGENEPVGNHNLFEDYRRIIDVSYGDDRREKKKRR